MSTPAATTPAPATPVTINTLWHVTSEPLELQAVEVTGKIRGLTARIAVAQVYQTPANYDSKKPLVFKYPLQELGVICDARVFINNEPIRASVAKKNELSLDNAENINVVSGSNIGDRVSSLGRYITFSSSDIYVVQVDAAPASATIKIQLSFTTDLQLSAVDSAFQLVVPTIISPRVYKNGIGGTKPGDYFRPPFVQHYDLTVDIAVCDFASPVGGVSSPSLPQTTAAIARLEYFPSAVDKPDQGHIRLVGTGNPKSMILESATTKNTASALIELNDCLPILIAPKLASSDSTIDSLFPRFYVEHTVGQEHPMVVMTAFKPKVRIFFLLLPCLCVTMESNRLFDRCHYRLKCANSCL